MKFTPLESAGWMDAQARLHNVDRGMGFCEIGEEPRRNYPRGEGIADIWVGVLSARKWWV